MTSPSTSLWCIPPHIKHLCYKTTSLQRPVLQPPIVYPTTHEPPLLQDHLSTETSPSTSLWCIPPHMLNLCYKTTSLQRPCSSFPFPVLPFHLYSAHFLMLLYSFHGTHLITSLLVKLLATLYVKVSLRG